MRRIYDSDALYRDDDEPGAPAEGDSETKPQAIRSIDSAALSRRVVPDRLRHWAISVRIETPRTEYGLDESVPFRVTMKNAMPFPITIATRSRLLWDWHVDGLAQASHVDLEPDTEQGGFQFDRGERKQFTKCWDGMFQVSASEWEPADPSEYTIRAAVNVDDAEAKGLADTLTVRLAADDSLR